MSYITVICVYRQHPLQTFAGLTMPGLAASSAKPATPQTNGRDTIKKKPSSGGLLRQEFHLAIDRYLPIQSISFRSVYFLIN